MPHHLLELRDGELLLHPTRRLPVSAAEISRAKGEQLLVYDREKLVRHRRRGLLRDAMGEHESRATNDEQSEQERGFEEAAHPREEHPSSPVKRPLPAGADIDTDRSRCRVHPPSAVATHSR